MSGLGRRPDLVQDEGDDVWLHAWNSTSLCLTVSLLLWSQSSHPSSAGGDHQAHTVWQPHEPWPSPGAAEPFQAHVAKGSLEFPTLFPQSLPLPPLPRSFPVLLLGK